MRMLPATPMEPKLMEPPIKITEIEQLRIENISLRIGSAKQSITIARQRLNAAEANLEAVKADSEREMAEIAARLGVDSLIGYKFDGDGVGSPATPTE